MIGIAEGWMEGWGALDRAARDAAYNNTAHVADSSALIAAREAQSAAFRAARPAGLDLAYGPAARNKWDLFPARDPKAPCLVFIHGGYWQRNSREGFASVVEGLCSRGWSAALPGYTLAPAASLTQIVEELMLALDWLQARGPEHGIAGPVVLSGWSAGGHLTALGLAHPVVKAGLAISGIFELGPLRDTYLNEKLQLSDEEMVRLSPARQPVVAKPLAIAYGTAELPALIGNSRGFHARRAASGAAGPLLPVPAANHFTILESLRQPEGLLARQLGVLLGT